MSKELTPKQEMFCREYVITLNFTDAALKAGYTKNFAEHHHRKLLDNPAIQERIKALKAPTIARLQMTADHVLQELFRIATCDIGQAFNDDGTMKPIHEIPEDVRRAIQAVEVEQLFDGTGQDRYQVGHTKKIRFWDKNKALEMLGKHFKLYTDKIEVDGKVTLEQLVAAANQKDEE